MFKFPEWFTVEKFWELKSDGKRQYEIAEMLGTTTKTLRKHLKRMGIEKYSVNARPDGEVLTEEDYRIAESNGIDRDLAYKRFYIRHMDKQKAITKSKEKVRPDCLYRRFKEKADANGICQATFYTRIHTQHMTPDEAATKPLHSVKRKVVERKQESILTPAEQIIAKKNGISEDTARYRILGLGMDRHKAITMQDKKRRRA